MTACQVLLQGFHRCLCVADSHFCMSRGSVSHAKWIWLTCFTRTGWESWAWFAGEGKAEGSPYACLQTPGMFLGLGSVPQHRDGKVDRQSEEESAVFFSSLSGVGGCACE